MFFEVVRFTCKMRASGIGGNSAAPRWFARTYDKAMALSRSSSWKEHRLADRLEHDGTVYSVDLVARKATGITGWRMSLVYLPREASGEVSIELPNAASTAEVRRTVRDLEGNDARLRELLAER